MGIMIDHSKAKRQFSLNLFGRNLHKEHDVTKNSFIRSNDFLEFSLNFCRHIELEQLRVGKVTRKKVCTVYSKFYTAYI